MDQPLKAIFTPPDQKSNANPNLCQMRWATSWSYFVMLEGPSDQSLTGHQQEGFPHLSHDDRDFPATVACLGSDSGFLFPGDNLDWKRG